MALAVCVLIAWLLIVVLAYLPKTLTELEMMFLFAVSTIFALSILTIFTLNLHWIEVSKDIDKSLANLVMRLVCIPLMLVIAGNLIWYSNLVKWGGALLMVLASVVMQNVLEVLGIVYTVHWNAGYTIIMFCGYIAFAWLMAWFIVRVGQREVMPPDHV